jgi:tryptophanyl-tRNA synthetase
MSQKQVTSLLTGQLLATTLAETTPGQYEAPSIHAGDVQHYGLVWLMRHADGTYTPVLKGHSQHVKLTRELPQQLGFKDLSYRGLLRLVTAGFVASSRITPDVIHIDLASLVEHMQATRDPEFWSKANRRRYSDASAEVTRS